MKNYTKEICFMRSIITSNFLRSVLFADAATCVATGLPLLFGSEILEQSMGLPATLLRFAGASLFPFAALLILSRNEKERFTSYNMGSHNSECTLGVRFDFAFADRLD
jgi:hypothetical protein